MHSGRYILIKGFIMRIESNSTALVYGNDYKPKSSKQAEDDLPELKKQLASEEENLQNLLSKLNNFGDSHKLITSTSGKGGHLDTSA